MRRIDIVLAVLFVALVVGLVFLPDLIARWRAAEAPEASVTEQTAPPPVVDSQPSATGEVRTPYDPDIAIERVSGILMLHQACVNRFEGFDARSRETLEAWKRHHAETLAKVEEQDFHIVLAPREDIDRTAEAKANEEELALCERNLEAMQTDLDRE